MTRAMIAKTDGQRLTNELRAYFRLGGKTRRTRDGRSLIAAILEELLANAQYPGIHSPERTAILRPGFAVALAWGKHVDGYRIDGVLRARLDKLTPWQFTALLGQMVDAGVTNNGEGEVFFDRLAQTSQLMAPAKRVKPTCGICGWDVPVGSTCRRTELHWTSAAIRPAGAALVARTAEALLAA